MYDQILSYIHRYLSPYLFGYRKGYSTEQCLIVMLEAWEKAFDGEGINRSIKSVITYITYIHIYTYITKKQSKLFRK